MPGHWIVDKDPLIREDFTFTVTSKGLSLTYQRNGDLVSFLPFIGHYSYSNL